MFSILDCNSFIIYESIYVEKITVQVYIQKSNAKGSHNLEKNVVLVMEQVAKFKIIP